MKKIESIIWGLIIIAIGIILGLNTAGITNINMFFKGWWTLLIIIPSFIGLFKSEGRTASIISLVIGTSLLLCSRGIIKFTLIYKLFLPFILVVIGLSMIFRNILGKKISEKINEINEKNKSDEECCATFSHEKIKYDKKEFKGTTLNAIFGGITLDLSNAKIKGETVINSTSIFGGTDIILPDNVRVEVKSNSIFGGVTKNIDNKDADSDKVIYINATCMFGGVDIK